MTPEGAAKAARALAEALEGSKEANCQRRAGCTKRGAYVSEMCAPCTMAYYAGRAAATFEKLLRRSREEASQ